MAGINFIDTLPGRPLTRTEDIAEFADELKRNPRQWAAYPWSDDLAYGTRKSRASDINRNQPTAPLPLRTGFHAAVRDGVLYVRYMGRACR